MYKILFSPDSLVLLSRYWYFIYCLHSSWFHYLDVGGIFSTIPLLSRALENSTLTPLGLQLSGFFRWFPVSKNWRSRAVFALFLISNNLGFLDSRPEVICYISISNKLWIFYAFDCSRVICTDSSIHNSYETQLSHYATWHELGFFGIMTLSFPGAFYFQLKRFSSYNFDLFRILLNGLARFLLWGHILLQHLAFDIFPNSVTMATTLIWWKAPSFNHAISLNSADTMVSCLSYCIIPPHTIS